jgi:predicted TIM-barrel fold metal-dependent hydrolase
MKSAPTIDAHHHIWLLNDLPWLSGPQVPRIFGPYQPICRDYPIDEYRGDIGGCDIVKSIYIQTNWPAGQSYSEACWVQSVSDATGWPYANVAHADLADPYADVLIERLAKLPATRGIRQQLHWHEDPRYRFSPRPDVMNDKDWRRGLAMLAEYGLLFELQIFSSQMIDGARLARSFPDIIFVLEHAGMLEDMSPRGWQLWREGMMALAQCPNVNVKLSGLGTFVHACRLSGRRSRCSAPIAVCTAVTFRSKNSGPITGRSTKRFGARSPISAKASRPRSCTTRRRGSIGCDRASLRRAAKDRCTDESLSPRFSA